MSLETKVLSKSYSTKAGVLKAVDGVNLTIRDQKVLGLVGESGSGKSTLVNLLPRYFDPKGGKAQDELIEEEEDEEKDS